MLLLPTESHSVSRELSAYAELPRWLERNAEPSCRGRLVERGQDLAELARTEECLFVLRSGGLTLSMGEKAIVLLEEGDLFGLETFFSTNSRIEGEFAVIVDQFPLSRLDGLRTKEGRHFLPVALGCYATVFLRAYAVAVEAAAPSLPDVRTYQAGETIVKQGDLGEELFTLVEGSADVLVDGVKTGEIRADEVFGALAALGGGPRTATVVAAEPSIVLVLTRDRLIDLIKQKPQTVEKMICDLGRIIRDLNTQLVALSGQGGTKEQGRFYTVRK